MTNYQADTLIIGAGLVGAAQALALSHYGISSIVVDKTSIEEVLHAEYDGRVSAISHASVMILEHIGIWQQVKQQAGKIERILVTEGGRFSDIEFNAEDIGDEPFGYMLPNSILRKALLEALLQDSRITLLSETTVDSLTRDGRVQATLVKGDSVTAELLIVADGRYSEVRETIGIKARRFEYGQNAIVCTVKHSRHHEQTAVEWFFPAGPLALLPMKGGHHSCIVWTEKTALAEHLVSLNDETFMEELQRKLSGSLGDVELVGRRYSYPLNLFQAESYIADMAAVIGDAAHAIHPIAGQGVNLGYRDVAVLTEVLVDAHRHGQSLADATILTHYQQWRRFDATAMIATTDSLNRLFSTHSPLVRLVRRTGMSAFQRLRPVKFFFMESAMGMKGDLPKMLQGESI